MKVDFTEISTDAIRYWEPRRVVYNAALVGVVVYQTASSQHDYDGFVSLESLIWLFVLESV